jgi:hypothetical protein
MPNAYYHFIFLLVQYPHSTLSVPSRTLSATCSVLKKNRYTVQLRDASVTAANFKKVYKPQDSLKARTDESVHRKNRYTVQPPDARVKYQNFQDRLAQTQKTLTREHSGTKLFLCGEKE